MPTSNLLAVRLSNAAPERVAADALVIGMTRGEDGPVTLISEDRLGPALAEQVTRGLAQVGAEGGVDEVVRLPVTGLKAPFVLAVGLGRRDQTDAETWRHAAGTAARNLRGVARAAFVLGPDRAPVVSAVAEGALLGAYAFTAFTSTRSSTQPLRQATLLTSSARTAAAKERLARAEIVAGAVHQARDWVNTPPGDLTPVRLAEMATTAAKQVGLTVQVLTESALRRQGFGGIVGVGQGSANPPRLVRLHHHPKGPVAQRVVFVGKGITFDSGGLSLKPNEGMKTMKSDMSGAAAVLAATVAVAELGLGVEVIAYAALAENMPSGSASRVSDVLRMFGGTTVEVLNTDAEGRLVLGDALARSQQDEPDLVVDVATLTGACVVALGTRTAGVMSDDVAVSRHVQAVGADAGELLWPLPIPEEMPGKLESGVADLANIGDPKGGALQAAAFLQTFVPEGARWAHLDIAGPAFNTEGAHGYTPKGATGFAVRTLVALAEEAAQAEPAPAEPS